MKNAALLEMHFQGVLAGMIYLVGDFNKLLENSIQQQIYTLPSDTELFPGHGPKTLHLMKWKTTLRSIVN